MTLIIRGRLRDFLRQYGVYVPHGSRTTSHSSLYTTSQLTTQPIWPENELISQIQHPEGLHSRLNPAWAREHGKEPLPRAPGEAIIEPQTSIQAPRTPANRPFLTPNTTREEGHRSIRFQNDNVIASTEEPERYYSRFNDTYTDKWPSNRSYRTR
jgi:hypothetical protein